MENTNATNGISKELLRELGDSVNLPPNDIIAVDVSESQINKAAHGYFIGSTAVGRRKDIRRLLENRVVNTIGKKGKYLVDKLFELVEGIYIVDRSSPHKGKEEIRYYKVPPSLPAIIYALDRVLGKPKQLNEQVNFSLSQLLISDNRNEKPRPGTDAKVSE